MINKNFYKKKFCWIGFTHLPLVSPSQPLVVHPICLILLLHLTRILLLRLLFLLQLQPHQRVYEMRSHPHRIELNTSARISTVLTRTPARKIQPIHLALNTRLAARTRVRIAEVLTTTAAELARRAYVTALVLLHRVDFAHASGAQHQAALARRHRLQKVVVVQVEFGLGGVAWLFFAVAVVAGGGDGSVGDVFFGAELLEELAVDAALFGGVFREGEFSEVGVLGGHA